MTQLTLSLLIVTLVSTAFAFSLQKVAGFWEIFVLTFILQFIGAYMWRSYKLSRESEIISNIINDYEETLERSIKEIECPCGNYTTKLLIFVNEDVLYECPKCTNKYKVECDVKTILTTEPLSMETVYENLKSKMELA